MASRELNEGAMDGLDPVLPGPLLEFVCTSVPGSSATQSTRSAHTPLIEESGEAGIWIHRPEQAPAQDIYIGTRLKKPRAKSMRCMLPQKVLSEKSMPHVGIGNIVGILCSL